MYDLNFANFENSLLWVAASLKHGTHARTYHTSLTKTCKSRLLQSVDNRKQTRLMLANCS